MSKNKPSVEPKSKKINGRPTIHNEELEDLICLRVATSDLGLPRLYKKYPELPHPDTINEWRLKYPRFSVKYAEAKMRQAELLAEQCLEISDGSHGDTKVDKGGNEVIDAEFIARSRLRVDTRKWLASKLLPKKYGSIKELEEVKEINEGYKEEIKALRKELLEKNERDY